MGKKGRPKDENSKNERFELRLTGEEMEILDDLSHIFCVSKSEFVRKIIKNYGKTYIKR